MHPAPLFLRVTGEGSALPSSTGCATRRGPTRQNTRVLLFCCLFLCSACVGPRPKAATALPPAAKPLVEPVLVLAPEGEVRDLAWTEAGVFVATGGALLRLGPEGRVEERFGPREGLEIGAAHRLVARGGRLAVASSRGVFLYAEGALRSLPIPEERWYARDVALSEDSFFALLTPIPYQTPDLCSAEATGEEAVEAALYQWRGGKAERVRTPVTPLFIAANYEGLFVADQKTLFFRGPQDDEFRRLSLGQDVEIRRLLVDPKERLWVLTNRGLLGGSAQSGIKALEGGEFFAGSREAVGLGFSQDTFWVATRRGVYSFHPQEGWRRFEPSERTEARFTAVVSDGETTYVGSTRGLLAYQKGAWRLVGGPDPVPSGPVRVLARWGEKIVLGTAEEAGIALSAGGLQSALDKGVDAAISDGLSQDFKGETPRPKLSSPEVDTPGSTPRTAAFLPISVALPEAPSAGLFAIKRASAEPIDLGGLSGGILALDADPAGDLWVAGRRGIRRLTPDGQVIFPPESETIGGRSITVDLNGNRWFAATDAPTGRGLGLLAFFEDGQWQGFSTFDGLPANEIYAVIPAPNGLWMAQPKGITSLNENGISSVTLPGPIFSLVESKEGPWAAGCGQVFRQAEGTWQTYPAPPHGAALALVVDKKGQLYAGNRSGLYRLDAKEWTYLPSAAGIGVSALAIFEEDGKERLWVGAESGAVLVLDL